jgi:hypothetical protein
MIADNWLKTRIVYFFLIVIQTVTAIYCFNTISQYGFPDGHLTDLERFSSRSLLVFGIAHGLLACTALIIVFRHKKPKLSREFVFGLVALHILMHSLQYWVSTAFNHGQGG